MADTRPNIDIPANTWVDLYSASGITLGEQLRLENTGSADIYVVVKATEPSLNDDEYQILSRKDGLRLLNKNGDSGAWAYVPNTSGKINVSLASGEGFYPQTPVAVNSIPGGVGSGINLDAWKRQKAVLDNSLFRGLFTASVPVSAWKELINDVEQPVFANASSENGKLVVTSNGVLNDVVRLSSFRHPRYEPNRGHLYSATEGLPNPSAAGQRTFGLFYEESGVGFRLKNDGKLYSVVRTTINGVTTDDDTTEIPLPLGADLSKGNLYDIQFKWRGYGEYLFYFNEVVVLSKFVPGTREELTMFNPALPVSYECINQGDDVSIFCGCVDVTTEGGDGNGNTYGSISVDNEAGQVSISGFNVPILAVRSKRILASGRINTRDTLALLATAYADQRSVFRVWATRDDTAITLNDQTWQDFGDGNLEYLVYDVPNVGNPIEFDESKAQLIFGARVDQDQSYATSALFEGRTDIYQTPGDIFVFTQHRETGGNENAGVTYEFGEAI